MLIVSGGYFFLFRTGYNGRNIITTVAVLMLSLLVANERFLIRPHLASLFFICVYFFVLERYRKTGRIRLLIALPLLQILWANMHGGFTFGIFMVGCYLAGTLLSQKASLPWEWGRVERYAKVRTDRLLLIFLFVIAANLINPFGYKGAIFPFEQLTLIGERTNAFGTSIKELLPPFSSREQTDTIFYYKIFLAVSLLSWTVNFRRVRLEHFFVYIGFMLFSLMARRNIAEFSLAASPIVIYNVTCFQENLPRRFSRLLNDVRLPVLSGVISLCLFLLTAYIFKDLATNRYYQRNRELKKFGPGKSSMIYPQKAVEFIKHTGIQGNMFNDLSLGGYLIWSLYPGQKVFIDGRLEVYGEKLFREYRKAMASPASWEWLAKRYKINYVILSQMFLGQSGFMNFLVKDPHWKLVYLDPMAVILMRNSNANRAFIDQYSIRTFDIPVDWELRPQENLFPERPKDPMEYFNAGNFFQNIGLLNHAEKSYFQAATLHPEFGEAFSMLGVLYSRQRRFKKAEKAFRQAVEFMPNHAGTHFSLGVTLHYHGGSPEEAERAYRKVISLAPDFTQAYTNLGLLYMKKLKRPKKAIKYLSQSLRLEPNQRGAEEIREYIQKIVTLEKNR